ncbi:MAG: hypothetical protein FXF47_09620 [Candidatus Mcinerneyibacterium aminivorans]|uniref:Calcineurin-like phosphoesterase domain-containing protein n=1 Tax=Candidatus Mcinerneyibacterium aminivorans TaxID=2703815 RepID=A0A5D0MES8_9BACT|nr:MAG: hypothetical protein FXF47_09620 [Candidatus Mcinerneyibacterium aminivorans]
MKIFQISDIHIGNINQKTHGVDTRKNFLKVLEYSKDIKFDRYLISGDLAFREPSKNIYKWIKTRLDRFEHRYHIIPGNHDDSKLLSEVFNVETINSKEIFYHEVYKYYLLIFLDTSNSRISSKQLKRIKELANIYTDKKIVLFMHHPPVKTGCKYMDIKYQLLNQNDFWKEIKEIQNISQIFSGHQHCDKEISINKINVYVAPSTFFQINCDLEYFEVASYNIGYRIINIAKNSITSYVNYLSSGEK